MATVKRKKSLVSVLKDLVSKKSSQEVNDILVCAIKVFDNLNQPYFIFDQQGNILYANSALLQRLNLAETPNNIFALTDKKNAEDFLNKTERVFTLQTSLNNPLEFSFSREGFSMMALVSYLAGGSQKHYAAAGFVTNSQDEQLLRSKNLLQSILDNAPMAIYTRGADGGLTFWNKKTLEIYEEDAKTLAAGDLHKNQTPRSEEEYKAREAEIIREGKVVHYPQEAYTTKEGSQLMLDLIKVPIPATNSNPACVLTIAQDITARYIQDSETLKTRNILQTIFNNAPMAIYARDDKGEMLFLNKKTWEIYGNEKEVKLNETPQQQKYYLKREQAVLKKGEILDLPQEEYTGSDGKKRIFHLIKVPVYDLQGKALMVITISQDVTQTKEKEKEVINTKNFLQEVLDNLPVAIYAKDYAGKYLIWNKKSEEVFGKKAVEVLGKQYYNEQITPEQKEFILMQDHNVFDKKSEVDIPQELISTQKDGIKIMHTVKTPLFHEDGSPHCLLGVSEDITLKTKMERDVYESRTKYSLLVENSREGILIFEKGKVSFANKTILKALNCSLKEIEGKTFKELASKEYEALAKEFFEKTSNGTASEPFELIKLRDLRGDSVVEFEVSAANSKYLGKKILIMFLRNITEERTVKSISSFATDRLYQVFENSTTPQVILQYNGYLFDMNRTARERFGFTLQEKPLYTSLYIKPSLPLKARKAMQQLQETTFDAELDFAKIEGVKELSQKGKFNFKVRMIPINQKELVSGKKVADFLLELDFKNTSKSFLQREETILDEDPLSFQDALILANRRGFILKANNQALQLLNLPFKDIEGRNLTDFVIPGERLLIQSDIAEVYTQNSIKNRNYNLQLKNSVLPVEASAVLAKDNNFLFSLRNNTSRRQLMDTLEQRSSYIQALHNVIGSALLECDISKDKFAKVITANLEACRLTGYTLQELIDKTPYDLFICQDKTKQQVQEYLDKVLAAIIQGTPVKFTAKIKTKTGVLSADIRVSYFETKTSKKAIFLFRDNTTEKELKTKLLDKEEELKGIRNILPGLYLKMDKNGVIKEYKADLSWTIAVFPSDFVGRAPKDYLDKNNAKNLLELLEKARQNNIPIQTNFSLEHTNGRRFYEAVISPLSEEEDFQILVSRVDTKQGLENRVRDLYAFSYGGESGFIENMEDILNFGKEIFKAQIGLICHFSGRAQEEIVINYATANSVIKKNTKVPVDECLGPVREGFISADERLSEVKCEKDCFHNKYDISSLIAAPLFIQGRVEGAICFISRNGALMTIGQEERNLISFLGGLMGVALELRKANKATDNSFTALRKLVASLDVPSFITDEYLALKNINEMTGNICGLYQFEEVQDKNVFSLITFDMIKTQDNFEASLKASKGGSFDFIFDVKLADGSKESLLWHVVELKDGSNNIKGFLFVGESIKDLPRFRNLIYGPQKHN